MSKKDICVAVVDSCAWFQAWISGTVYVPFCFRKKDVTWTSDSCPGLWLQGKTYSYLGTKLCLRFCVLLTAQKYFKRRKKSKRSKGLIRTKQLINWICNYLCCSEVMSLKLDTHLHATYVNAGTKKVCSPYFCNCSSMTRNFNLNKRQMHRMPVGLMRRHMVLRFGDLSTVLFRNIRFGSHDEDIVLKTCCFFSVFKLTKWSSFSRLNKWLQEQWNHDPFKFCFLATENKLGSQLYLQFQSILIGLLHSPSKQNAFRRAENFESSCRCHKICSFPFLVASISPRVIFDDVPRTRTLALDNNVCLW